MTTSKVTQRDVKDAAVDLSGALYRGVILNGTDQFAYPAADGDPCYGVVTEAAAAGLPVTVAIAGIAKIEAGAAIATGAKVMLQNATGKALTATATKNVVGIARTAAAADGEVISVQIDRSFVET